MADTWADPGFEEGVLMEGQHFQKLNALTNTEHWKYPETVGNDTGVDDINYDSHQSSEYAKKRMSTISTTTSEPFMLFEFMTIDEDKAQAKITKGSKQIKNLKEAITNFDGIDTGDAETVFDVIANKAAGPFSYLQEKGPAGTKAAANEAIMGGVEWIKNQVTGFIKSATTPAERNYTGSIALYMPTDIQINDSMVYNEDTRKLGAALNAFANQDGELINWVTLTDPAVLAAASTAASAFGAPAALSAVIGGTVGTLIQGEMQRHTGKIMNPNELVRYQSTGLRSFTFNWTILPDNEDESKQATGLIKFFRKSAHAKRSSSTLVTVPDHVICSFHGGGVKGTEMIQLPPCFVETVNVTYNPNNTSFFKQNNAPVEIGLSVGLKEIVPIYAGDVERGY